MIGLFTRWYLARVKARSSASQLDLYRALRDQNVFRLDGDRQGGVIVKYAEPSAKVRSGGFVYRVLKTVEPHLTDRKRA